MIPPEIHLDYETYSEVNIKDSGAHAYIAHPSFEVLCFSYSFEPTIRSHYEVKNWDPSRPIPQDWIDAMNNQSIPIYARNADFERLVTNKEWISLGLQRQPVFNRWIDSQAISSSFGFPAGMGPCGLAVGLPEHLVKNPRGRFLINKLTKPKKWSKATPWTRWTPYNAPGDFQEFYEYCDQDVVAETAILNAMPKRAMRPHEQLVWQHTVIQNERGIHIDVPLVKQIIKVLAEWQELQQNELINFTQGAVETGNQRAKILQFCADNGHAIPDLTAQTVQETKDDPTVPKAVRKMMWFRQILSKTSTAKFKRMLQSLSPDGTVKGNLIFHKTITGRYAGSGLMIHNLPRRKEKDPDPLIHAFYMGLEYLMSEFGVNVMELASKLIRPCLIAPPGYELMVSDFSAIENRVLHWLAGDIDTLNDFANDVDQYRMYGAEKFGVPYDEVDDFQRLLSKIDILGLGYMMGWKTYKANAASWGIDITDDQAKTSVNFYRNHFVLVKRLWYQLYETAVKACKTGSVHRYGLIRFLYSGGRLYMKLPSGRCLCYNSVRLVMKKMPWGKMKEVITFMGLNPYSHKWSRLEISPGRLTENADQAISWDLLVAGLLNVERAGYPVIGSVHDEGLVRVKKGYGSMEEFNRELCNMPSWADGLPMKAVGYRGMRYKKD